MKFLELLADIEKRPLHYMRDDDDVEALQLLFAGYTLALRQHRIGDDLEDFNGRFAGWLGERFGWNTARGWAAALRENASSEESLLHAFFLLTRQFLATTLPAPDRLG